MFVIEQPLPAAPAADFEAQILAQLNAVYDAYNEVACLILGSMTPKLHRQFENSLSYDMIKELKSVFEKQARVERFDLMYEKGLPKKASTPQVMTIQGGRIQKANNKSQIAKGKGKGKGKGKDKSYISKPKNLKPSAKERPTKDDACHHCKEVGHWKRNYPVYLAKLIVKKKQVGNASSSGKMTRKPFLHRIERATDLLGIIYTDVCGPLRHASRQDGGGEHISQEFKDYLKACEIVQQLTPPYTPQHNRVSERRNRTLLDMVWGCEALVKRDTPDKLQQRSRKIFYLKKSVGGGEELEEIQDEDTSPSENTRKIPMEGEGLEPPQEEVVPIRRFARTHRAPNRLCLNVEVEEHSLRDLNKPTYYKASILDSKFDKWVDTMNAEMQSMKNNQV
ncbi:retrotransposon protein, putative, ty1-copia subclass [Tanacetum coccineum]